MTEIQTRNREERDICARNRGFGVGIAHQLGVADLVAAGGGRHRANHSLGSEQTPEGEREGLWWNWMGNHARTGDGASKNLGALLFRIPPVLIAEPKRIGRS